MKNMHLKTKQNKTKAEPVKRYRVLNLHFKEQIEREHI